MRKLFAALAVLSMVAAGCGNDDEADSTATTAGEADSGYRVQIDGETAAFNAEFTAYFPGELKVHPGEKVTYDLPRFSGAPHTVTLGTLIDAAAKKVAELGPTASIATVENDPAMLAVDDFFPRDPGQGPPMANQTAGQPCFIATGEVPGDWFKGGAAACPKVEQPDFDGTQSLYNSGVLAQDAAKFELTVADSTPAGSYSVMCLIHRAAMIGRLTVVDAATDVPSADEQGATGKTELEAIVAGLTPVAEQIQKGTADKAAAGAGDPKFFNGLIAEFGPKEISIPVGGTVTWSMFAFHSVTFNSTPADAVIAAPDPDGNLQFNLKALGAEGFKTPPAAFGFPPPDNGKPITIDGGKWDGEGFRNTGIVGSLPPVFITVKQTFTKAGTYAVACLVHPDMKGEVKVG